MVRGRVVVAIVLLLVVPLTAGCLGSSSTDSSDQAPTSSQPDPGGSNDSESSSEEPGASGGDDGNATGGSNATANETTRETFQNQSTVIAQASVVFSTPAVGTDNNGTAQTSWTLFGQPPDNFTGALVEVTWDTQTAGTPIGQGEVELEAPNDNYQAAKIGQPPLRIQVTPKNWTQDALNVRVSPPRAPTLWVNAQITVHTTYWTGGAPNWDFSAVG